MIIEFRSDTFSLPTREMLDAIAQVELGNDGYGEDPTVCRLEKLAALKLGKEAACLMPSGTMANLASVLAHCRCQKGIAVVGDRSDIHVYEAGGAALCPGVVYLPVRTEDDGTLSMHELEEAFREHRSRVAVICIENPHNLCGGVILPPDYLEEVAGFARAHRAKLHLDGARIFNAAVASETDPARMAEFADSVQFCLSKGLAAPVGSLVAGNALFISKVRKIRTMLGGTMRQAGIIAAPGIVALERMVERLKEDHTNARCLAEGIAAMPGIDINLNTVQTNTVVFRIVDGRFTCENFIAAVREYGINISQFGYGKLRAVVHHGTTRMHIDKALEGIAKVLADGPGCTASDDASADCLCGMAAV